MSTHEGKAIPSKDTCWVGLFLNHALSNCQSTDLYLMVHQEASISTSVCHSRCNLAEEFPHFSHPLPEMRHLWRKFSRCSEKGLPRDVPPGHLAVNVGEAGRRFIIKADYLNLPVFRKLLDQAYQEYGLHQDGPLSLPCDEFLFEEIIQSLKCGMHARKCSCHVVNEKQGLSLWNDSMPLLKEFPRSPAYQRQSCKWQGQTTQQMYAYAFSKTCIAVKVKGNDDERLCKTIIWFSNKKLVTNSRGTYHLREAPHSSCNHMVMDPRYRLFRKVSNEIGWYGERCRNDFDHNKALSIGILSQLAITNHFPQYESSI
ncbi:Small auxin-up RNA [Dillenia turbinata]|uniref:Small auxin-up RNA n=1 Tax=Dillenia turbinata TaxID=194707 RepID=A0AAN8ZNJ1_9MAGN